MSFTGNSLLPCARRIAALAAGGLAFTTLAVVTAAPAQAAPPANDDLAANQLLPATGDVLFTNEEATVEGGEPSEFQPLCIAPPVKTVWFRYVATSNDVLRIDLDTAPGEDGLFDSVLSVFTSSTPATPTTGSLSPVVCNDDQGLIAASRVEVRLTAGTTYFVQMGSSATADPDVMSEQPMTMHLTTSPGPPNDNFADATTLTAGVVTPVTTDYSTAEPNEPLLTLCTDTYDSAWFKFTAPADGVVDLELTNISDLFSVVTAYKGPPVLAGLSVLDCGQFSGRFDANLGFAVNAGETYWIQLGDGGNFNNRFSNQGASTLLLSFGPAVPGDDLADAVATAVPAQYAVDTTFGSTEPAELSGVPGCGTANQRTRWFTYTPTVSGDVALQVLNADPLRGEGMVSVYSGGPTFPQLHKVLCSPGLNPAYRFHVVAGQTYYIEAGTLQVKGSYDLRLRSVSTTALTAGATTEGAVTLDATVGVPSGTAPGRVDFYEVLDSGLLLQPVGSAPVAAGQARLQLSGVARGQHYYRATYVPSDPGYLTSTSDNVGARVAERVSTTSVVTAPKKVKRGTRATISVTVLTAAGLDAAGNVTVTVAGRAKVLTLEGGEVRLRTRRLTKPGQVTVLVEYAGSGLVLGSTASTTLTVKKGKKPTSH